MVMVNLPTAGVDYHVPFGGRKGSSYGPREQGRYAAEFYTTMELVTGGDLSKHVTSASCCRWPTCCRSASSAAARWSTRTARRASSTATSSRRTS